MKIDRIDLAALRTCARLCWQRRDQLALTEAETEQVLIAWMAVGTPVEGEAASELLRARREAERHQANFDRLLSTS